MLPSGAIGLGANCGCAIFTAIPARSVTPPAPACPGVVLAAGAPNIPASTLGSSGNPGSGLGAVVAGAVVPPVVVVGAPVCGACWGGGCVGKPGCCCATGACCCG